MPSVSCEYLPSGAPEIAYARLIVVDGLTYRAAAIRMGIHKESATRYRTRLRRYVEARYSIKTSYCHAAALAVGLVMRH
jgi:hypothetical protein